MGTNFITVRATKLNSWICSVLTDARLCCAFSVSSEWQFSGKTGAHVQYLRNWEKCIRPR